MKLKEMLNFAQDTKRKKGMSRVEGLEDANYAGKKDKLCVLAVTEGLSALTYLKGGVDYGLLGVKGRDYIGMMPIRGKFLNVKNASPQTLSKNTEVKAIIQAMGLVYGEKYSNPENYAKLRYKKFVALADSDVDGFHIVGLLYNFFHTLFPDLLDIPGFFNFMRTPIMKLTKPKVSFFYQQEAVEYIKKNNVKKDHIAYFKGLGTSEDSDIKEDFGRRVVQVNKDEKGDTQVANIFAKEHTSYRKEWLTNFQPETSYPNIKDYQIEQLDITSFLNKELILFSLEDCRRSIPSIMDGLKESQRKVLFGAFKENLKHTNPPMKVAQFAAAVAKVSQYHHGEQNLGDTIVKLAQRFVGSNNVPLLFNKGQFGSRSMNGQDAASPRYIFTRLEAWTRLLFKDTDEDYLTHRYEDGDKVEPEYYMPVLPLILINGNSGIGSGWSTNVASYKIDDMIEFIKFWLKLRQGQANVEDQPTIRPHFRGFKGQIMIEEKCIRTTGVFTKLKENQYQITELPIGRKQISIVKYRKQLEKLVDDGVLTSFRDNSVGTPNFIINVKDGEGEMSDEKLGLTDTIFTSNMVLFNKDGKIHKYHNIYEIMDEFCEARLSLYEVRKQGEIQRMKAQIEILENKVKFIEGVINKKIVLQNQQEEQVLQQIQSCGITKKEDSYDYLLSMAIRSLTSQRLQELHNDVIKAKAELKRLEDEPVSTTWLTECSEFVKTIQVLNQEQITATSTGTTKKVLASKK